MSAAHHHQLLLGSRCYSNPVFPYFNRRQQSLIALPVGSSSSLFASWPALCRRAPFAHYGFVYPTAAVMSRTIFCSVSTMDEADKNRSIQLYGQIERADPMVLFDALLMTWKFSVQTDYLEFMSCPRVFTDVARRTQGTIGDLGDWQEIEGAWVLRPEEPVAIVHFTGGVFVGAAPQLTYRSFLEQLAKRGYLIIATPFASGFDHFRIADEAQFKFDRCLRMIKDDSIENLPVFGVGHSMGALMQLLIGARYAVQRAGNVLISFNNKEASKAIPLFSPVIVPMAQNFGPLISQLMESSTVRMGAEVAIKNLQNLSPPFMKQILPLIEQLPPLYMDLANGKDTFTPHPDETRKLIKSYYGIRKNLLIRFKDDDIDETPSLAQTLSFESGVSSFLDMSIRTLPGGHARPLQQVLPVVPPQMADAVSRGSEILANLAAGTPWADVARDVSQSVSVDFTAQRAREQILEDIEMLVEELDSWMKSSLNTGIGYKSLPL